MPLLVNNEVVEEAEIRAEARSIRPHLFREMQGEDPGAIEAKVREWARENVIERILLRQAAGGDLEPVPEGVEDPAQFRIERLLARTTRNLAPPRNKDITEYYRKNRDKLIAPERVHAAHILKNVDENRNEADAMAVMQAVAAELRNGGDFVTLADQHSDCPGNGGDLGVFPRGEMVPEFDAVVFNLEPGQVSGIFRTPFGFHIAKVYQRWPEGVRELNEVRAHLVELLFNEKKQRAVEQFLDRLRAKADIREA